MPGNKPADPAVRTKRNIGLDETMTGSTRVTAVFGYPVHHSLSPVMHNAAFGELGLDFVYVPCKVHPEGLGDAVRGIRALDMVGANLTIPHKEHVIKYLDRVSEEARIIGSVNTVVNRDGSLHGYSTDGIGFIKALECAGKSPKGSRAVILGAGGSARAIAYALLGLEARITILNRTHARAVELADVLNRFSGIETVKAYALDSAEAGEAVRNADLLVNCTSVGMYPNVDEQPIPSNWLHKDVFVYDQIYNPLETKLLKAARGVGASAANGVGMLVFQGASAFELWTGQTAPVKVMEHAVLKALEGR